MKQLLRFFNWLICILVSVLTFQSGIALPLIDNPTARHAPSPGKSALAINSLHKSQRLLVNARNRPSADPIRFTLTCNKPQVAMGEQVELTITAQLLNIPANLMFFLPGSTGYSLKLLSPEGFRQTESELSELVSEELAYPTRTTATYHVRGYFVSATDKSCFRLLRGSKEATAQSLFETKATLCLTTEPKPLPLSSPRARTGSESQTTNPTQLYVRSSLTSADDDSTNLANNAASGCTSFAPVCSGNNQEVRTVTINVVTAGSYPLTISYRSPEANVDGILRINNVSQNLRFSQTNAYATVTIPSVQLRAGDNTIGLSSGVSNGVGGGYLCFNSVCVGSSSGGCTPPAAPTVSASTTQVCPATAATLTASGCSGTVTWSSGHTGSSINVNNVGNYSATCTINGCASGSSNALTLTACPAQPTPPNPPTQPTSSCTNFAQACSGNNQEVRTVTINVVTAGSYPLTISYRSPEANVDGILRINNVNQNLRFSQTNAYATVTIPSVQLRAGDNTIGLSSGVSNGVGGGYLCFNSVCVGSSSGGCTPPAAPTVSASTTQVCPATAATLTASGCSGTVTWSSGHTGSSINVNNVGNYSATCTINGCASSSSNALTLTACPAQPTPPNPPTQPTSSCTNFAQACSGNNQEVRTVTINVVTAGSYPLTISYRSPEANVDGILRINNVSQNLRFSQTNAYATVTIPSVQLRAGDNTIGLSSGVSSGVGGGYLCFNSVCVGSSSGGCTPPAAPTVSASTTQVCPATAATLTASGCSGTVTWSSGHTGSSINVNNVGNYSAICTINGCPSNASTSLTLTACPTPSGCAIFAPVCSGNSKEIHTVTINMPTAGRYPLIISYRAPEGNVEGILRVNNSSQSLRFNQVGSYATVTTASLQLKAGDNTIELSSGVAGGYLCFNSVCAGDKECTPPAAPTLSASTTQVCPNNSATLTASGCSGTVTWSTGQTGNSISVNNVGNYSAICTTSGCVSTSSKSITLVTCPALPVSGCTSFVSVCSGNSLEVRTVIVNVAKAGSYPLAISYRAPEGNVDGIVRINNASQNLRFNQASSFVPVTIASVLLRAGDNTIELSSGAGGGYVCFNSVCAGNGGGCTPPAAPTVSASTTQVCPNASVVLTASGCSGTVTWSTGLTGNSISVNTAGNYSAICTTASGCASGSSTLTTLTTCATPPTGSCSIDDYSAEINIIYKP